MWFERCQLLFMVNLDNEFRKYVHVVWSISKVNINVYLEQRFILIFNNLSMLRIMLKY